MRAPSRLLPLCVFFLLAVVSLPAAQESGLDCFAVIAGRAATADGSVLFGHNEDDGGRPAVHHWKVPGKRHAAGDVVRLVRGGEVAQVEETFACIWSQVPGHYFSDTYLNQRGVAIASNACPSREDDPDVVDGGIGFMLRRIVAERARTAREGVDIAIGLLEQFGYAASGRTLTIAGPQEAWVLCMVRGKHWVAARVPDDKVLVLANSYPIHTVDLKDRENWRVSPGLVEYATQRGWYDPQRDGAFEFARAYARESARRTASNYLRQWGAMRLLAKDPPAEPGWRVPTFFTPRKKLVPADLMAVLRDHYEGTKWDRTVGYRKGRGGGSPNRTKVRTICTRSTRYATVFQLRPDRPVEVGALMWVAMCRPDGSVFLPWYIGMREIPPGFSAGKPEDAFTSHFHPDGALGKSPPAFAVFERLCDRLDRSYGELFPRVKKMREALEADFLARQPRLERMVLELWKTDREAALEVLDAHVRSRTEAALEAARELLRELEETPGR